EEKVIKNRADSILAVVKRDRSKFEAMVTKFSDDPGSKNTGGVYEWFDKNRMVPEFTKASFDEKPGAITIAKTSYGYHIVEVLG
ncbi:MAG: peptidylprolyl isomerase, partial [Bacteroidetes bacterium]|nr:peptidylprolyl isomerase [Bacteroidota bacterium]